MVKTSTTIAAALGCILGFATGGYFIATGQVARSNTVYVAIASFGPVVLLELGRKVRGWHGTTRQARY